MASKFVEFSIYGKLYFLWILCIVKLSKGTSIALTCPEGWVLSGTMCYRLFGQDTLTSSTWDNAYRVCKGNGAEMVTVDDFFTNQNVGDFASAQNTNKFWTGMSEKGVTTQNGIAMTWNTNVAASIYQGQWSVKNPDKAHGDCVYIEKKDGEYVWTINSCLMKMAFVCQRTPCLPQSFHCDNGRCVNSNWHCDGVDDCGDFSDEVECAGRCSYLLDTASSGRIQSPNHPSNYQPSRVCTWTIVGPEGSNIYLEFTSFNTEKDTDIVEVLIGGRTESTARSVARLSGQPSLSTARYRSYNNYMIIRFSTDSQTEKVGFTANYNSSRDWYPRELYMTAGTTVSILEPPLFSSYGSNAYLGNRDYVWIIKAEERQKIVTLERIKIDLTGYDVIEIRDGDSGSATLLEKYMVSNNDNVDLPLSQSEPVMGKRFVFSTSNVMYVIMRTSGSTSGTGFSFQYRQGCVARYTADAGEITSPGYPNVNYANFQTCTWTIDIPSSKGVKVMLDRSKGFEIADNEDFIQIYTNSTDDSGNAAHGSGAWFTTISLSNDQPFHSPNGKMFIRFKSTAITNKKGFRLIYSIDCPDPGLTEASEMNPSQTAVQLRQFDNEFTVSCKNGYSFHSDELNLRTARMKCMYGGKWLVEQRTRSIPQCKPNYCGEPVAVENGYISHSSGVVFGSFVTFTCFPGFTLLGSANITCQFTQWTSRPQCVSDNCPAPPAISNGQLSSSNNQYAAIVNYTCNDGYQLIGVPILFCQSTGQWTASAPQCKKVTCPIPGIKNGIVSSSTLPQFQEILTVSCVEGYMINGSTAITCGKDRSFDVVPNCIAEVCSIESLRPTFNNTRSCVLVGENVICTYVCKAGYIYYDGITSKDYHCSGANKWSPTINPEVCLLYEAPTYKVKLEVSYVSSDTLSSNCKAGFENMLIAYNTTIAKAIDDKCSTLAPGNFIIRSFTSSTLSFKITTVIRGEFVGGHGIQSTRDTCINFITIISPSFILPVSSISCSGNPEQANFTVENIVKSEAGNRCSDGMVLVNIQNCVKCPPGRYFNGSNCVMCAEGQYQNLTGQSSCKSCDENTASSVDRTTCVAVLCLIESLRRTSNAVRSCYLVGVNVTCTYVCKTGYIYFDGTTSKQYHCSGANKLSSTTNPEDCLLYEAPSFKAKIDVQYVTTDTLASNCKAGFENMLVAYNSTIAKAIDDKCNDLNPGNFAIRSFSTITLSYKITTVIRGEFIGDGTTSARDTCINFITVISPSFILPVSSVTCLDNQKANFTVERIGSTEAGNRCSDGMVLVISHCVKCPPGRYFNGSNCVMCAEGQYQNLTGQSSCKSCDENTASSVDRTTCVGSHDRSNIRICTPGFTGENCSVITEINECDAEPCMHGGNCTDRVNDFECACPEGWTGKRCEMIYDECTVNNKCPSSSQCLNIFKKSYCKCPKNTYGEVCENSPDICRDLGPCLNSAVCTAGVNALSKCTCPNDDYRGIGCEIMVNHCGDPNKCENGGTCVNLVPGFRCDCPSGYAGANCSINVNDCTNNCPSTSTCIDMVNAHYCRCPLGKTGESCARDLDTNYDLYFYLTSQDGYAALPYPIYLSGSSFSLSVWVRFYQSSLTGTFLTIFTAKSANSLASVTKFLSLDHQGLVVYDKNGQNSQRAAYQQQTVTDGQWNYVVVSWNKDNGFDLVVNSLRQSQIPTTPYTSVMAQNVWVTLGANFDSTIVPKVNVGFRGYVSQLNIYNRRLSFENEIPQLIPDPRKVFSGSILHWNEFVYHRGVKVVYPSSAQKPCTEANCLVYNKKFPTFRKSCTSNVYKVSADRLTSVTWTEPIPEGATIQESTYKSGDTFSWGKYTNIYALHDPANSSTFCSYNIYVIREQCPNPDPPHLGTRTCERSYKPYFGCTIGCTDANRRIDRYTPKVYTCGPSGAWNPSNRNIPLRFPSCGLVQSIARRRLMMELAYPNISATFCDTLALKLRETFTSVNTRWSNQICSQPNCSDMTVDVNCLVTPTSVKMIIPTSKAILTRSNPSETLTVEEIFIRSVLESQLFDFSMTIPNGSPDLNSFTTDSFESCPNRQSVVDGYCVKCGPGNFFNSSTLICEDCPVGTYQDQDDQTSCTPCPQGSTTQTVASPSSSDCKASSSATNEDSDHTDNEIVYYIIGLSFTGVLIILLVTIVCIFRRRNLKLVKEMHSLHYVKTVDSSALQQQIDANDGTQYQELEENHYDYLTPGYENSQL